MKETLNNLCVEHSSNIATLVESVKTLKTTMQKLEGVIQGIEQKQNYTNILLAALIVTLSLTNPTIKSILEVAKAIASN